MSGFDQDRFYDLTEREENILKCNICRKILNDAVISGFGHSYCKGCVQQRIKEPEAPCWREGYCPSLRQIFTKMEGKVDGNAIIIGGYVFRPNLMANEFVSRLSAKCDFESNGCKERVYFGAMALHIHFDCEYNLCPKCELKAGRPETHNCVELLKKDRDELKTKLKLSDELKNKFENREKLIKEMNEKNKHLAEQVTKLTLESEIWKAKCNEAADKISKSEEFAQSKIKCIVEFVSMSFGTWKFDYGVFYLTTKGIRLVPNKFDWSIESLDEIFIPLEDLRELSFSSNSHFVIKITFDSCNFVTSKSYYGFYEEYKINVQSTETRQEFMTVKFDKDKLTETQRTTLMSILC